jgi:hypothetical protein
MGYAPEGMTPQEVIAYRRKAYLRFYSRPRRMATMLKHSASPAKMLTMYRRVRARLRGLGRPATSPAG